ncbi:MAG TPA: protein phosphatase 2C domain-containing protein [Mobilitalea sp.]|nr:protein phosphatase 2C domain-containing protein [Mobilitalea sp.]
MFLFKRNSKTKKVTDSGRTRRIKNIEGELSYQVGNLQKIGARSSQEDSFALINALDVNDIRQNGLFAIVADGMGGMKDGKLVSETAVAGFVQAFRSLNRDMDISRQLVDSVSQVNSLLNDKFDGEGGTTVVLAMIYKGMAYWVSVGDSSIYLKRNGGLFKLNRDHTYRNKLYLEELYKVEINKNEVESNKDGVRLSEFLGNSRVDEIDNNIKPLKLKKNDVIMLCSDGISGFMDEDTISDVLSLPPEIACEQLGKLIDGRSHKNQDNLTAVVISCMN